VDIKGIEAVSGLDALQVLEHIKRQGSILRVVGVVGQIQKLELEGSHLRQNGSSASPARRTTLSSGQVDGGVGQAAVGIESLQESLTQIFGAIQEHLVARELVGTEQSSELANSGLKERNFAVNVGKVEVSVNPISTFLKLISHVHNVKSVQSVDDGYTHSQPVRVGLGNRLKFITTPSKAFVGIPSVSHGIFDGISASSSDRVRVVVGGEDDSPSDVVDLRLGGFFHLALHDRRRRSRNRRGLNGRGLNMSGGERRRRIGGDERSTAVLLQVLFQTGSFVAEVGHMFIAQGNLIAQSGQSAFLFVDEFVGIYEQLFHILSLFGLFAKEVS